MSLVATLEKALEEARRAEGLTTARLTKKDIDNAQSPFQSPRNPFDRCATLGVSQGLDGLYWIAARWGSHRGHPLGVMDDEGCILSLEDCGITNWEGLRKVMRDQQVLSCAIGPDPEPTEAKAFAEAFPGYVTMLRFSSKGSRGVVGNLKLQDRDEAFAKAFAHFDDNTISICPQVRWHLTHALMGEESNPWLYAFVYLPAAFNIINRTAWASA